MSIQKITDPIQNLEEKIRQMNEETGQKTKSSFRKYPVIFSLLITFALVCILYGFELIMSKIAFIQSNPWFLILLGLIILISTGSTYKILDKK